MSIPLRSVPDFTCPVVTELLELAKTAQAYAARMQKVDPDGPWFNLKDEADAAFTFALHYQIASELLRALQWAWIYLPDDTPQGVKSEIKEVLAKALSPLASPAPPP